MIKKCLIFGSLVLIGLVLIINFWVNNSTKMLIDNSANSKDSLKLTVANLLPNNFLPKANTCDGEDLNPGLEISGVPRSAQSLVLILNDPDAPSGEFIHWLLWNISIETEFVAEGQSPVGANAGTNSFGRVGYSGPCPPKGTHRYVFKLIALDTKLDLPVSTTIKELESALTGHIISRTEVVTQYKR